MVLKQKEPPINLLRLICKCEKMWRKEMPQLNITLNQEEIIQLLRELRSRIYFRRVLIV